MNIISTILMIVGGATIAFLLVWLVTKLFSYFENVYNQIYCLDRRIEVLENKVESFKDHY